MVDPVRSFPFSGSVPPSSDVLLRSLADLLALARPAGPMAVGVSMGDGECELAVKALVTGHPFDAVAGFVAPSSWHAFAIVAAGTAHCLDRRRRPQSVSLAALAARDRTTASALFDDNGNSLGDSNGDGRMLDACRRVLALPTEAPRHPVAAWTVLHWLDSVVNAVLTSDLGRPLTWAAVRSLDRGSSFVDRSWSHVRDRCAAGELSVGAITATSAAWMDDGLFSREAIGAYPDAMDMIEDLWGLLPRSVYHSLLTVVTQRLEAHCPSALPI